MNKLPLISCVCPTFGKINVLEESIQSFLNQKYNNKELIIFNNYIKIDLVYHHPQIKIINCKKDIYGIGNIRNIANQYAKGSWIAIWDDDDIYLKNRLTLSLNRCLDQDKLSYIGGAFYSNKNIIYKKENMNLSTSFIHKNIIDKYPYTPGIGEDQYLKSILYDLNIICKEDDTKPECIYRWGTETYHISGNPDLTIEEQKAEIYEWTDKLNLPSIINLNPHWDMDYEKKSLDFFLNKK